MTETSFNWTKFRFWILTTSLILILVALVGLPFLHHFELTPLDGKGKPLSFWLLWELLSIGVTVAVTLAFWISIFLGERDDAIMDGAKGISSFGASMALIAFAGGFVAAGYCAYNKTALEYQVLGLLVGVGATVSLQVFALRGIHERLRNEHTKFNDLSADQSDKKKACAQLVRNKLGERDNLAKYLCFSDLPIAVAIGALVIFVWGYSEFDNLYDEHVMRTFVAGAVAVQLLYSNLVFWLEAFAQTDSGYQSMKRLPAFLHAIRAMLRPEEDLRPDDLVCWANSELKRIFDDKTY